MVLPPERERCLVLMGYNHHRTKMHTQAIRQENEEATMQSAKGIQPAIVISARSGRAFSTIRKAAVLPFTNAMKF